MTQQRTELKDVLHFYLGCECIGNELWQATLAGIYPSEVEEGKTIAVLLPENQEFYVENVKPILRSLQSMTEEEAMEIDLSEIQTGLLKYPTLQMFLTPDQFIKSLSKSFDLWNLIDSGQAIDADTLKQQI